MSKLVLGFTGAFGSGCTKIINDFILPKGFEYISLSGLLRDEYIAQGGTRENLTKRDILQNFGNDYRKQKGANILAIKAIEKINQSTNNNFVIDSIRNPAEIEELREKFVQFFLIGIFANRNLRWDRVKRMYGNNSAEFDKDEERDKGEYDIDYGQRVTECFLNSDLILSNNKNYVGQNNIYRALDENIKKYIGLFRNPFSLIPTDTETLMAIAYANSQRSNCLKRKVGAIIEKGGNIISSGYNEVPPKQGFCLDEYDGCFRDKERNNMINDLVQNNHMQEEEAKAVVKKIKILEKCRALHAEETAIINIARFGDSSALNGSTIYTTTYPCNLCANKIVQVQIKKIIYFEPYPVEEARIVLDKAEIDQEPFEGITFKSYFKVYGKIQM